MISIPLKVLKGITGREGMDLILNRVAWMYYYGEMNQQDIADQLNISRVKVNRLLKQAQKEGVVEITINPSYLKMFDCEDKLQRLTGLDHVVVVPDTFDINDSLSRGAAHLFNDVLKFSGKLGMGLSQTLGNLHKYIDKEKCPFESVISICGTSHPDLSMTSRNVGFNVSDALGVPYYTIWAPVLVSNVKYCDLIKQDDYVANVLEMARNVDVAIVGIGHVDSSHLTKIGYISDEESAEVKRKGGVGEIIGHYYTEDGKRIESTITRRLISVDFPMKCPVIGVAGGEDKLLPVLGAIRSGILNGLVVNESVAKNLIPRFEG